MRSTRLRDQALVIFGASGDLTSRKLIPALYRLHVAGDLADGTRIVGTGRTPMTRAEFARHLREHGDYTPSAWRTFAMRLDYVPSGSELPAGSKLYYCATPPAAVPAIIEGLDPADAGLVVEKPFGTGGADARALNRAIHAVFDERQVFRIDHYLGKETVLNILAFRFANGMFEPIWNRRHVQRVEITVAEELGVEGRGKFYDQTGAIRDILQNHVLQVLTFLALEPPVSFEPESLRDEKVKILKALRPVSADEVVRGQYRGYRSEPGVSKRSTTETYAAARFWIDNWRWAGVPFIVRTGKRLKRRVTEVTMTFNDAPLSLFPQSPTPNHLTLRIQPNEGICLSFDAKLPGRKMVTRPVEMDFRYDEHFGRPPGDAYDRLLHDALHRDHTLFIRADEVEAAWKALDPVLASPPPVHPYTAGTWGPRAAEKLGPWVIR